MAGGGQLNPLLQGSSRLASLYNPVKRYSHHGSKRLMEERAPSVAQEFERVAAEKIAAQTQTQTQTARAAGKTSQHESKVDAESANKETKLS